MFKEFEGAAPAPPTGPLSSRTKRSAAASTTAAAAAAAVPFPDRRHEADSFSNWNAYRSKIFLRAAEGSRGRGPADGGGNEASCSCFLLDFLFNENNNTNNEQTMDDVVSKKK